MIIGITGGTGCGKTTALDAIARLGGTVIDCDAIYHRLLKEDEALLRAIEARFPHTVTNRTLDRKKLADIVFADEKALLDLNAITHGAVKKKVLALLSQKPKLAGIDAIALFESGLNELCDTTVAITAPEQVRIDRLMARDNISLPQAKARIAAQKPQAHFVSLCDHHLHNDGTQAQFLEKCLAFFKGLL